MNSKSPQYKKAGIDINAGYQSTQLIKKLVKTSFLPQVISQLGNFSALFELNSLNYKNPVLVSGTDGVGSKLDLAIKLKKFDTIGIDLVAMCVNDIVVAGAQPLFFLDYIAIHKNQPKKIESLIQGMVNGCKQANCSLIGGETAEMPSIYAKDHFDLAGFVVGIVEKEKIINGSQINPKDVIIGLESSGIHSNGFTLIHKILATKKLKLSQLLIDYNQTLGEVLLTPTIIYVNKVLKLLQHLPIKGLAHITGGGFYENIPRIIPKKLGIQIIKNSYPCQPIFTMLQQWGNISNNEMFHVFNMGIGLVLVIAPDFVDPTLSLCQKQNIPAHILGEVTTKTGLKWV